MYGNIISALYLDEYDDISCQSHLCMPGILNLSLILWTRL